LNRYWYAALGVKLILLGGVLGYAITRREAQRRPYTPLAGETIRKVDSGCPACDRGLLRLYLAEDERINAINDLHDHERATHAPAPHAPLWAPEPGDVT
jgi:hypothetical protein